MKKQLLLTAITLFFLTGCNNNKTERETIPDIKEPTVMESKEERNKQIALQCINAWDSGNIDEIVQHLASNTVDYGDGSTPPARGIEAMKSFMELWRFSVEEYQSANELAVSEGDYVFIYADWSGTFKSDFMGLKTAGKSFAFKDVDIFRFDEEGKITEHRAVLFSTLLKQIASNP